MHDIFPLQITPTHTHTLDITELRWIFGLIEQNRPIARDEIDAIINEYVYT